MSRQATMRDLIAADMRAWKRIGFLGEAAKEQPLRWWDALALLWRFPGLRATCVYRLSYEMTRRRVRILPLLLAQYNLRHHGFDMVAGVPVGPGFYVPHPVGTVITARSIGRNCHVISAVTIGMRTLHEFPTIGDDVVIGCGARVLGDITVGDGVTIGANAVVITDAPAGATMVGVPAAAKFPRGKRDDATSVGVEAQRDVVATEAVEVLR